jgi:hypothetical protein
MAATQGPPWAPPEPRPRRHRGGGLVLPVILIALGAGLLLQNFGLLSPGVWAGVWRLWPLLLVLVGLDLLLGRRIGAVGMLGIALIVVGAVAVWTLATSGLNPARAPGLDTRTFDQPLQGASQANIEVRCAAGQLDLGPLPAGADDRLASMTFQGPPTLSPSASYQQSNAVGQLQYAVDGRAAWPTALLPWLRGSSAPAPRMDVAVSPLVPVALTIQTGAADAHLDLDQLRATKVDLAAGASTVWLRLPSGAGPTTAYVRGGLTELTIEVPAGVAAQIRYHGGLNSVVIDQSRFPAVGGDLYRSPGYDSAPNRVDLSIDSGLASVRVT